MKNFYIIGILLLTPFIGMAIDCYIITKLSSNNTFKKWWRKRVVGNAEDIDI
jgi:hypothetical protein